MFPYEKILEIKANIERKCGVELRELDNAQLARECLPYVREALHRIEHVDVVAFATGAQLRDSFHAAESFTQALEQSVSDQDEVIQAVERNPFSLDDFVGPKQ